jgi:hypothetical protein
MGKRSDFERFPRDFYPTPFAAVPPLIPHLRGVRSFAEPCCGDGALVRHLEAHGLRCAYAGDIATGQDALALTVADCNGADAGVTNPPYDTDNSRKLMHALIVHLERLLPTWLLLHLDWSSNKHARPFLFSCSDIVVIGRVQWIEGSKGGGMENFAWYRFDARHKGGPIFHPRGSVPVTSHASLCAHAPCGKPYRATRSDSKFCSDTCRQRAHRARLAVTSRDATRDQLARTP